MRRALLAGLCLSMGVANAANIDPLLAKTDPCGRFEIFHINGIMTDRDGATANLGRIREVYGNSYKEHLISYNLAFNQTRGFTSDLVDSAKQVISGYAGATWDSFMNAVTFGVYSVFMPQSTAAAIAKKVTDLYAFTKPSAYQDQDLADLMLDLTGRSQKHARVVLIPHSQGNLYANLMYDKWISATNPFPKAAKSIGVVGVAVPYFSVKTGNTYITSANDVVIDAVRIAIYPATVLPANVTIPYYPAVDRTGHFFRQTYLDDPNAKNMLITKINSEFNGLKTTAPDPNAIQRTRGNGRECGSFAVGGYPQPCWVDIPTGAPYQYYQNTSVIWYNVPNIPEQQHALGDVISLASYNQTHSSACYAWYLSDRKAQILKFGVIPTSPYGWPYNIHSGSCGYGFPWQTPYGRPDIAWTIYSADSSKLVSTNWVDSSNFTFGNDLEKIPVCTR